MSKKNETENENPFADIIDDAITDKSEIIKEDLSPEQDDDGLNFDIKLPKQKDKDIKTLDDIRMSYGATGTIAIRPYINSKLDNMGLSKQGMVVFPGCFQKEDMASITFRGKNKYITGLDEFSPSIQKMKPGPDKDARILQIRTIVSQLEREKAFNHVDVDDPKFWSKATTFRPDNKEIWSSMSRNLDNKVIYLSPRTNLDDLLTIISIENGGYPGIAKSYEDAVSNHKGVKWFLDKEIDTVDVKVSSSKLKNKALGVLDTLSTESPRKLFFICKLADNTTLLYNFSTQPNIIYNVMDNYITGKGVESSIKTASKKFLEYADKNIGELKLRCVIKDAAYLKLIVTKGDQMIHMASDNTLLGRNMSEVYEYLMNPINDDVRQDLTNTITLRWSK